MLVYQCSIARLYPCRGSSSAGKWSKKGLCSDEHAPQIYKNLLYSSQSLHKNHHKSSIFNLFAPQQGPKRPVKGRASAKFKRFKKRSRVKPAMRGRNEGVKRFRIKCGMRGQELGNWRIELMRRRECCQGQRLLADNSQNLNNSGSKKFSNSQILDRIRSRDGT